MVQLFSAVIIVLSGMTAVGSPNAYDINVELSLNGEVVSTPRLIVKEGESAIAIQEPQKIFLEVVATEQPGNQSMVKMIFVVGYLGEGGQRTILSQPRLIVAENELAQVTVGQSDGRSDLSLSVVAKKTKL